MHIVELCNRCHSDLDPLTHYVIVRADLPRGIQAAQLVHAAGESSPGNLPNGTHAIVLSVPDELALQRLSARLHRECVMHVRIEEPDSPYDGALMAVGIPPARKGAMRQHLSSLALLK